MKIPFTSGRATRRRRFSAELAPFYDALSARGLNRSKLAEQLGAKPNEISAILAGRKRRLVLVARLYDFLTPYERICLGWKDREKVLFNFACR